MFPAFRFLTTLKTTNDAGGSASPNEIKRLKMGNFQKIVNL
jgi:hypothetical protein